MNQIKYKINNYDFSKKYHEIVYYLLKESCSELSWYFTSNEFDEDNKPNVLEFNIEKNFNGNNVTYTITCLFLEKDLLVDIVQTSFHGYGINGLLSLFFNKLRTNDFERVTDNKFKRNSLDYEAILDKIFEKFHASVNQLNKRHDNRATLEIKDEYDVQDYLHSILILLFDDVRDEDPIQKIAGASSRVDFFLPKEGILIETKMASDTLKDKKLGEQISIDLKKYQGKKEIKKLIFFVYDPYYKIKNPIGLETDFSGDKNLDVRLKIFPK